MAKKRLRANDGLIVMVIKRQAGSVAKANVEGIMNCIDAGATKIEVFITNDRLAIIDNGKGFTSEAEVDDYFAEFGNPHELDDEGCSTDAKFGTFRIGRGQLFAFGINTWHTNHIRLGVDVNKTNSLEFDYDEIEQIHKGCYVNVDLYETLTGRELAECIKETEQFCRYVDVDITINGERANKPPSQQKWTKEDDFAYVRLKPDDQYSGIEIYQQGVYVETIPAHKYGLSGTVVTKVPVKLNFARNQIIRSCPKWKKITKLLTYESKKKSKKQINFKDHEKAAVVRQYLDADLDIKDFHTMRVFTDVTGKDWSISTLKRAAGSSSDFELTPDKRLQVAFAPIFDNMADKAMQSYKGVVLATKCATTLGFETDEQVWEFLCKCYDEASSYRNKAANSFELTTVKDMMQGEDANYLLIKDPTPTEAIILNGLESLARDMESAVGIRHEKGLYMAQRLVRLGDSTCADGWTDGKTYVAINRRFLNRHVPMSQYDAVAIIQLYLHELCHNAPDTEGHGHDMDFYKKYHDEGRRIKDWACRLFDSYLKSLRLADRKIPQRIRRRIATTSEATSLHTRQELVASLTHTK